MLRTGVYHHQCNFPSACYISHKGGYMRTWQFQQSKLLPGSKYEFLISTYTASIKKINAITKAGTRYFISLDFLDYIENTPINSNQISR